MPRNTLLPMTFTWQRYSPASFQFRQRHKALAPSLRKLHSLRPL